MKFISWNVNGLRAVAAKGFADDFKALDADCFCLQETKMQAGQLDLTFEGYESFWNYAEKKGYSGTAIYTRVAPLSFAYGLGVEEHDHEGRVVTLEFPDYYLVCVYTPNSQDGLRRLDYRMGWEDAFRAYLLRLNREGIGAAAEAVESGLPAAPSEASLAARGPKGVIVCGDMNVAHEEIDIKNPATNHHNAGFTDEERQKMTDLLAAGFTDTWRYLNPDTVKYSWWSYRFKGREKNIGWRIDYFLVSDDLRDRITGAEIHNEVFGSDHCPVELDLR